MVNPEDGPAFLNNLLSYRETTGKEMSGSLSLITLLTREQISIQAKN